MVETQTPEVDYTLNNPDTLTKYKTAAGISHKVLEAVTALCVEGEKIVEICQKGDQLLDEEIAKVYKGKKIAKGISHPTTVSPSSYVTPYTPLVSDAAEAEITLKAGEIVKIQLGAQIDGFGTIVCDMHVVAKKDAAKEVITGREADLIVATHYANELLLRLMVPAGLLAQGTDEEKAKAAAKKPPTQSYMSDLLEKIAKAYDCKVVENTTSWMFDRNEIEGNKKIILVPGEGVRGEGVPDVGEVWGVEVGLSLGSGKVKNLDHRTTLHRRTTTTYGLKRPSSRQTLSEVVKKFGTFPFSLRQLDDEKSAKVGVVECVRGGVLRQYEPAGETDGSPVSRLLSTVAITKNGLTKLAAPAPIDLELYKSDKKIEDEEILKILEQPLARSTGNKKSKSKKKKTTTAGEE
ncbi:Winged helix-turn-helix transcription repressor DNA-binding [Penicillium sp. IBT 35674x]|uniref:Winged helix-turn-helix transcription repressor DNA-binding n=1 Tax=Penicillium frequentans TaxID=3151616 RepID=A0AAD6CN54_9EURO|nr:Winged helix-turn-helix transcription repressor DNA-binding [Penicillium glabrum]KAJ5537141.1 Winged helix-turn-helix transcription repressor DNA-binding [Penicillium glabrum]KAJ5993446.1 Winged helix-turn-helix transcription repressor DNA-binding [Penicillium sp. IBT 35674x]